MSPCPLCGSLRPATLPLLRLRRLLRAYCNHFATQMAVTRWIEPDTVDGQVAKPQVSARFPV
jgi:hypothetical protein